MLFCCIVILAGWAIKSYGAVVLVGPSQALGAPVVCGLIQPGDNLLGQTDYHTIYLGQGACTGSFLLWQERAGNVRRLNPGMDVDLLEAEAALVLEHERGHILFGADERTAECYGVHNAPGLLMSLGITGAKFKRITTDILAIDLMELTPCL